MEKLQGDIKQSVEFDYGGNATITRRIDFIQEGVSDKFFNHCVTHSHHYVLLSVELLRSQYPLELVKVEVRRTGQQGRYRPKWDLLCSRIVLHRSKVARMPRHSKKRHPREQWRRPLAQTSNNSNDIVKYSIVIFNWIPLGLCDCIGWHRGRPQPLRLRGANADCCVASDCHDTVNHHGVQTWHDDTTRAVHSKRILWNASSFGAHAFQVWCYTAISLLLTLAILCTLPFLFYISQALMRLYQGLLFFAVPLPWIRTKCSQCRRRRPFTCRNPRYTWTHQR